MFYLQKFIIISSIYFLSYAATFVVLSQVLYVVIMRESSTINPMQYSMQCSSNLKTGVYFMSFMSSLFSKQASCDSNVAVLHAKQCEQQTISGLDS